MFGSKANPMVLAAFSALLGSVAFAQEFNVNTIPPIHEQRPETAPFTREWRFETGWDGFKQGTLDQGDAAAIHFMGRFEGDLAPWLHVKLIPEIDMYSARVQTRFDPEEYQNKFRMREGFVALEPIEAIELRAGFINQGYLNQPLLVKFNKAFPGAQELIKWDFPMVKLQVSAEQVVPTSYTLDDERQDQEALPTFQVEAVKLRGEAFQLFEWSAMAGHYAWRNPPSAVAFASALWGNSVDGEVAAGSQFRTGFSGWMAGFEACTCLTKSYLQVVGEFQRFRNTQALVGLGDAQLFGIGPRITMGERVLDIRFRKYFIEKDATIATYTSSGLAGTNRDSNAIEAKLHFNDHKFAFYAEWIGSTVIRDNIYQSSASAYTVGVETDYAPF